MPCGRSCVAPSFGRVDRLVVLADVLSALHAGPEAFARRRGGAGAVARALRWRGPVARCRRLAAGLVAASASPRVAFAATKADHVAERQRGNLAALAASLTRLPARAGTRTGAFAIASVRCTEDFVWTLDGRPVSAVRGRVRRRRAGRRGPIPARCRTARPAASSGRTRSSRLPDFEPMRLPLGGRGGVPHINLDALLAFLLDDVL